MTHLRRVKCQNCGNSPHGDEPVCTVCHSPVWIWHCDRHGLPALEGLGCQQCGILFAGRAYYWESDLAAALTCEWVYARQVVVAKSLALWAKTGLCNDRLAKRLGFLAQQAETQPDAAVTAHRCTGADACCRKWTLPQKASRLRSQMWNWQGRFSQAGFGNGLLTIQLRHGSGRL